MTLIIVDLVDVVAPKCEFDVISQSKEGEGIWWKNVDCALVAFLRVDL